MDDLILKRCKYFDKTYEGTNFLIIHFYGLFNKIND